MTLSYPMAAEAVKPTLALSPGAESFLRWLCRWHSQTGDVHPSTPYLARKQRKSERTIYRWLAELRQVGAVSCDVQAGVLRRVVPLVDPPSPRRSRRVCAVASDAPAQRAAARVSGVLSGGVSGVPPITDARNAEDASTTQVVGVVADLVKEGVTPVVATALVAEAGEEVAREQVEALPFRKSRDRAAVLVASIKQRWAVPVALEAFREARRQEVRRAERARMVASVASERAERRQELLRRFSGLSTAEREALEARALALWRQEQPAAARLLAGRAGGAAVVRDYALRLLAGEVPNVP